MKTHKYARKPFYVDAARVTSQNMEEMAEWCGGTIKRDDRGTSFIEVEVDRPRTDRQTQAYVGDWVLFANGGFKVYVPKAFDRAFERKRTFTKEEAEAAGITVPHEPRKGQQAKKQAPKPQPPKRKPAPPVNPVISQEMAAKINAGNISPDTISATKLEAEKGPESPIQKPSDGSSPEDQEAARKAFLANQEKKLEG